MENYGLIKKNKKNSKAGNVVGLKAKFFQRYKVFYVQPVGSLMSVLLCELLCFTSFFYVLSAHWYMEDCGAVDVLAECLVHYPSIY